MSRVADLTYPELTMGPHMSTWFLLGSNMDSGIDGPNRNKEYACDVMRVVPCFDRKVWGSGNCSNPDHQIEIELLHNRNAAK
ncbi:hypothetical protein L3Y34_001028 [Caenorhabditis briggsae]|uniref:Uncharacterized protein n=1 Tax=Caenorhabditis briggsae TaxID=6238 RepID=A0AAE9IQB5_CAEBR|nr:hypothetical protein L3Y34_001028 [Caenorhabditis briggsae]